LAPIPERERGDLISAYHRRLTGTDANAKRICAQAWTCWEMSTCKLIIDKEKQADADDDFWAEAFARIESHYFVNGGFFDYDGQIIKEATKIQHIPGIIVQGRYDMVCPMKSAWDLHQVWTNSQLKVIQDAGHSFSEIGILSELVKATDYFKHLA